MSSALLSTVAFIAVASASVTVLGEEDTEPTTQAHLWWKGLDLPLYPATLSEAPDIPSPAVTADGVEVVTVCLVDGRCVLTQVTIENGEPYCLSHHRYGKGRQLAINTGDFPALGRVGLHSETELDSKERITGRPVWLIDAIGRPGAFSRGGFFAEDESILSVLKGDNRLVTNLGLTHPQLARPLFHMWNLSLIDGETRLFKLGRKGTAIDHVWYNGRKVRLSIIGTKGYQESIFHDEIQGGSDIHIWCDLEPGEHDYMSKRYGHLGEERLTGLIDRLSHLHIGEMAPFYAMRYGFYEGHTSYRADPIAVAFIFRLISLVEIDQALGNHLYEALTEHFRVR